MKARLRNIERRARALPTPARDDAQHRRMDFAFAVMNLDQLRAFEECLREIGCTEEVGVSGEVWERARHDPRAAPFFEAWELAESPERLHGSDWWQRMDQRSRMRWILGQWRNDVDVLPLAVSNDMNLLAGSTYRQAAEQMRGRF